MVMGLDGAMRAAEAQGQQRNGQCDSHDQAPDSRLRQKKPLLQFAERIHRCHVAGASHAGAEAAGLKKLLRVERPC